MIRNFLLLLLIVFVSNNNYAQYGKFIGKKELESPINNVGSIAGSPALSLDGQTMVFVTNKDNAWKMYESTLDKNGKWTEPRPILAINNFGNAGSVIAEPFLTYDGKRLYFSANYPATLGGMDIFYSERISDKWATPINAGNGINSVGEEGSPSLNADNTSLYFTRKNNESDRGGDCKKILTAQKNDKEQWTTIQALPIPINLDCEDSPYISYDGKTLYFASMRTKNVENYDLYCSKQIIPNVWTKPLVVDSTQSAMNDKHPSLSPFSDVVFYSQQSPEKRKRTETIFATHLSSSFLPEKVVIFKGKVTLDDDKTIAKNATMTIRDYQSSKLLYELKIDSVKGEYFFVLPAGKNYQVEISKPCANRYVEIIKADTLEKSRDNTKNITLFSKVEYIVELRSENGWNAVLTDAAISIKEKGGLDLKFEKLQTGQYKFILPIGKLYEISVNKEDFETYTSAIDLSGTIRFPTYKQDIQLKPTLKEFEISVLNYANNQKVPAWVDCSDSNSGESFFMQINDSITSKKTVKLKLSDTYVFDVASKGYFYFSRKINVKEDNSGKIELKLRPLLVDLRIETTDIQFIINTADFTKSSYKGLEKLLVFLKMNPSLKLELGASPDKTVNSDLVEKRLNSIYNYLKNNKIDTNRLLIKVQDLPLDNSDNWFTLSLKILEL